MIDPTQYGAFFGENAVLAVSAIAFSLVACVFAFLGKRKGCWKYWGMAVVICSLAATILLRVVFYSCGGSVLYMM